MAFLIVGLGSMGLRRARNLQALGEYEIFGQDLNASREKRFVEEFGGRVWSEDLSVSVEIEAVFICTPPKAHSDLISLHSASKPVFVEASVTEVDELEEILAGDKERAERVFPSITMHYFNFVKHIDEALNLIGAPRVLSYHVGHHIEDWHPWESPKDFYVSSRETGACRELIPFELGWLTKRFGLFVPSSMHSTSNWTDYDIESVYGVLGTFEKFGILASLTFEVLSRPGPTRELRIIGKSGLVSYSADSQELSIRADGGISRRINVEEPNLGVGVNSDAPYEREVMDFLSAVRSGNRRRFPNTLAEDIQVLRSLEAIDELK